MKEKTEKSEERNEEIIVIFLGIYVHHTEEFVECFYQITSSQLFR